MPIDPLAMALIAGGGAMSQAGAPSRAPVGFGQALSQGMNSGLAGYMQAQQMGRQQRLDEMQMLETSLMMRDRQAKERQSEAQRSAMSKYLAKFTPEQRSLAEANPELAMKYLSESEFKPTERMSPFQEQSIEMQKARLAQDWAEFARSGQMSPYQAEYLKLAKEQLAQRDGSEPVVEAFDPNTGQVTYVPRSQAYGKMAPPSKGMRISYDAEGRPIVETGVSGGELTTAAKTGIQERALQAQDRLARLSRVGEAFAPKLLTLPQQGLTGALKLGERMGFDVGESGRKQIEEQTTLKRRALEELNQTLRDMSGAAITPQEADRLRRSIPDPDNDSPTEFTTKYNDIVSALQGSHQRYLSQLGGPRGSQQAAPQRIGPEATSTPVQAPQTLAPTSPPVEAGAALSGAPAAPERPGPDATFDDLVDFYSEGGRF